MDTGDLSNSYIAWNLQSKLRIPQAAIDLVSRERLLSHLTDELKTETKLCAFTAPAGFGKTTTIIQFLSTLSSSAVSWLRLDSADSQPKRFLSNLILSLTEAGFDMSELELAAKQGALDAPAQTIVAAILARLSTVLPESKKLYMVLDDYHLAESPDINACLEMLLQASLGDICFVVSSRFKLPLKLSSLRLNGQLLEVGEEALRFDEHELQQLFRGELAQDSQTLLFQKTQGWVAVLQLAKIWGQADLLQHFNGGTEDLADYITEQVIADLNVDEQKFLLDTAMLDQVHVDIADYIRASNDSHYYSRSLLRLAPLVSAHHAGEWISYHPLLKEYLQQRQQYKNRQRWHANCLRAAQWYSDNQDIYSAVRFYCQAGDFAQAYACFKQHGGWQILMSGGHQLMGQILSAFPAAWIDQHPDLALFQVYLLINQAKLSQARSLFHRVVIKQSMDPDNLQEVSIISDIGLISLLLRLYEDQEIDRATLDQIIQANLTLSPQEGDVRAILLSSQFVCQYYLGDIEDAKATAISSIQVLQDYELPYAQDFFYFHLSMSYFWKRDFEESKANIEQGIQFSKDNFGSLSYLTATGQVLLAQNHYYSHDLEKAQHLLGQALATVSEGDSWFAVLTPAHSTALRCAYYSARGAEGLARAKAAWRYGVEVARSRGLARLEDCLDYVFIELLCESRELQQAEEILRSKNSDSYQSSFFWFNRYSHCLASLRYCLANGVYSGAQEILASWQLYCEQHELDVPPLCQLQLDMWQHCLGFYLAEGDNARQELAQGFNHQMVAEISASTLGLVSDLGWLAKPLLETCLSLAKKQMLSSRYCQLLQQCLGSIEPARIHSDDFSARELEVIQSLAQGNANKVIARQLNMTENTVKFHLKRIYKKLGVEKRVAAVNEAGRLNLL